MKAQLTFLSVFMNVLMLLLILALCFTGASDDEPVSAETQPTSGSLSIKDITDAWLHSVLSPVKARASDCGR